ncbi:unnamed protein product [Orchesella dallaii]|uniref:Uncharacterized protein n=1 Tax=Orchesella dallaii TaxID=48710 RepID=A0ABP1PXX8_9HEXA
MAKRMKLISEKEYEDIMKNTPEITAPVSLTVNVFSRDKNLATDILNWKDLPDDIKLRVYSNLMQTVSAHLQSILSTPLLVKQVDSDISNESSLPNNSLSSYEESTELNSNPTVMIYDLNSDDVQLASKLPVKCQKRGKDILRTLKEYPELVKWNRAGEISFLNGPYENDVRQRLSKEVDAFDPIVSASDSGVNTATIKSTLKRWFSLHSPNDITSFAEIGPAYTSTP